MSPRVALLRGVNVGGKNRLPMAELAAMFETAGALRVETLIQSGNVVFEANAADAAGIAESVGAAIVGAYGFRAPIVFRDAPSWREMLAANPFVARDVAAGELHVAVLSAPVSPARLATLPVDRSPPGGFVATANAIYLHLPDGVARTKLTNAWLDAALGVVTTIRNWATVTRLAERLAARE